MKRQVRVHVLTMVCGALALAVRSAETPQASFTSAAGDLASPSGWGGQLPAENASANLEKPDHENPCVYTLGSDLTLGSLTLAPKHTVFDFTGGNRTLTLTRATSGYLDFESVFHFPHGYVHPTTVFKGGVWNCSGQGFSFVTVGYSATSGYDYDVTVTNVCVFTNISTCLLGRRISNMRVRMHDSSELHTGKLQLGFQGGTNNVLEVLSGSRVSVTNQFLTDDFITSTYHSANRCDVSGEGSLMHVTGRSVDVGAGNSGNGLRITDGAAFTAPSATVSIGNYWGSVYCTNNFVEVTGGSSFAAKEVKVKCHHNRMIIRDSSLSLSGLFTLGPASTAHHNMLVVSGPQASVVWANGWNDDPFGQNASDNVIEVSGGASWRLGKGVRWSVGARNTLRVTGQGTVFDTSYDVGTTTGFHQFDFGPSEEDDSAVADASVGNRIEITDGAVFRADRLFVHGYDSRVVVSNATLEAGSVEPGNDGQYNSGYSIWMGRQLSGGQKLVIQGSTPRVCGNRLSHDLMLMKGSALRYEIPPEGYPEGHVAVELKGIYPTSGYAEATEKLEIECDGWAARAKAFEVSECILFRCTKGGFTENEKKWIAAQRLDLPANVRLIVRESDIVLRRNGPGFLMTVR